MGKFMKKNYFVHKSSSIDKTAKIGAGTKIWYFCHVSADARVGSGCNIGQNVFIDKGVIIGNRVKIQNNVSVYAGVEVGDGAFLGPSCVFTNVKNPRSLYPRKKKDYLRTPVGSGATIGANATIVCGHSLGKNCFVGAGAVVTKDVPDYALVVGNPARRIGWMCECGARAVKVKSNISCKSCGKTIKIPKGAR
jgi:UDP-2-acetamido-3-amino-2,3-dideoxy-glucuronate N-acetyltransferase